jgi:hypothetical protein
MTPQEPEIIELFAKFKEAHAAFVDLRCCGEIIGIVNSRPFTPEASARFHAIEERLGNAWTEDPEAQALIDDPTSCATPPDGTPVVYACATCRATFVWIGGAPMKVQRDSP